MSGLAPEITQARAKIAATKRWHPDRDTGDLRRDLRAAALEQYIRRVVDTAPPLTEEQRSRLAVLLRPATGGEVA
ncbi:hypothetical protein ACH4RA_16140 [Streptomyces smyrnaeus]|uniref:hypothetical protein n=1 Tax=Streptomyces smyrnaeus TaxID=1387713 RepID=UPI0037B72C5C